MNTLRVVSALPLVVLFATASSAQQYVLSTVAGGAPTPLTASTKAVTVPIGAPLGVATDSAGNVYFASMNCVFKLDLAGVITRLAGNSRVGYSGDGGLATNAQLSGPSGIAVDGAGNIFVADAGNSRIRRVSANGIITTVAGNGAGGYSGDGGPAQSAQLWSPTGVALDGAGNFYIADYNNNRVRKVSTNGIITTVAGTGTQGAAGDGGLATKAQMVWPSGVAVDGSGNLLIVDSGNNSIRKVTTGGIISTAAGTGISFVTGDGFPATAAGLGRPYAVAADGSGNYFIADSVNGYIRKVSTNGIISTVAGSGISGFSGDGGPALSAQTSAWAVAVDTKGNLFIADQSSQRIRRVSTDGNINTVAGSGNPAFSGDGGAAGSAQLSSPVMVAPDASGNLFVADTYNNRVRKISANGSISTVAGSGTAGFSGDGGSAIAAQLSGPYGVAVDASGSILIADTGNYRIRKVTAGGTITTIAGTGVSGTAGDNGPASSAQLSNPGALATDSAGNIFIADQFGIRKISTNGNIATVAGNGRRGFSGDGGPATSASLFSPAAVAVDGSGSLFIADQDNFRVRKVSATGTITTIAGDGVSSFSGDGGPASKAELGYPGGVAADASGNIFVVDTYAQRLRKISANGTIATIAGTGNAGYYGDSGPASSGALNDPYGVAADSSGNVYIADRDNNAIRMLKATNQLVLISAVLDSGSESIVPVAPGKIVSIYGGGLGPAAGVTGAPVSGAFGTQLAGTTVSFNGVAAPLIYAGDTQVIAIVPYAVSGTSASVSVAYQGGISSSFSVPLAASSPGFFTANSTGAGQAAAVNAVEGTLNTAASPVKIGSYISLYLTGEGQTTPAGADGKLGGLTAAIPNLPVTATVDNIPAVVQYRGGVFGAVAGLMQVNVQIPAGVKPGGYVPVVLTVGGASTVNGAVWIAVSAN